MQPQKSPLLGIFSRLWRTDAPLTATGLLMMAALLASLAGLALDPRIITGAPAWLKPAKFAASTAIFALTLAWIFQYLPEWVKTRRVVGWSTAIILILEVAIIDAQAWRGVTSHFNVGTPLDLALWMIMGSAIVLQTLLSITVAVALWRQRFQDRALEWALRLGVSMTIIGASTGGFMPPPTSGQLAQARATGRMTVSGAHTVGAPDGGPGLPATNWSTEHGDLRIPHFLGLHAMQALPLIAFWIKRQRLPETAQVRLVITAAGSYALLFVILLQQALRAQPLIHPDTWTLGALACWAALTAAGAWMAANGRQLARA